MISPSKRPIDIIPPDTGCEYSPRCLKCPLRYCRYDVMSKHTRNAEIKQLFQQGMPPSDIATLFNLKERTVTRIAAAI